MVGNLYEWLQNLAFYLVLVTAIFHIIPESNYKKYIQFFTGLVLIIMIISPIMQLFGTDISIKDFYQDMEYKNEIKQEVMEWQEKVMEESDAEIEVEEIQIE